MRGYLVLVVLVLSLSLASAQIYFNQEFEKEYNLNDLISINFTIEKDTSVDYVTSFLTCNDVEDIIYRRLLDKGTRQTISFYSLAERKGNCEVSVEYGDEKGTGSSFEITNLLQTNISINNKFFYPSESLNIFGDVSKINGEKINGSIIMQIKDVENKTFEILNGKFNFNYTFSKDIASKNYSLSLFLSETGDFLVNLYTFNDTIYILQKPSYLETVSIESFKPAGNFSFSSYLQDQSRNNLSNESIIIKVFDPSNSIFYQGAVLSGSTINLSLLDNAYKGTWKINSYYGSIFNSKQFFVLENKKVVAFLDEITNTLVIKNIGNIPYEGIFNVNFSNENETIPMLFNLTLGNGEEIQQTLDFNGNYTFYSEGSEPRRVSLTGAVISTSLGVDSKVLFFLVIFLVFILVCFVVIYFFKRRSGKGTKNSVSSEGSSHKLYAIFLEYSSLVSIEDLVRDRGLNLQSIDSTHGFIVFSSDSQKFPEEKIIKLFLDFKRRGLNISASAHSQEYNFKKEKIKEAIATARKLSGGEKGMYISQDIFSASRNYASFFKFVPQSAVGERVINRYLLSSI